VLRLIEQMLKAGCIAEGKRLRPSRVPSGRVVSPVLSNILLTPFDWRCDGAAIGDAIRGRLGCYVSQAAEAQHALAEATKILTVLG